MPDFTATLIEKVSAFPKAPGVYLMKDAKSRIIYVGKAKELRQRVRQYFNEQDTRYQIKFLMERVHDVDFLVTPSESEALLLENSLIKKHKPKYNVFLKDDKSYLGLKLTLKDPYPRLLETRRIKKDGSVYYGPFTSAESLREVKDFIDRFFMMRTCSDFEFNNRTRPCLEYQIKRCSAPCVQFVSQSAYAEQIRSVKLFLDGKSRELQTILASRMNAAADALEFEEAARLRDLLRHMENILKKQNVTRLFFDFMDVIAFERRDNKIGIAVLMVREGQLIDSKYYVFSGLEDDGEAVLNFAAQYYSENAFIPRDILLPFAVDGLEVLSTTLTDRAGFQVFIREAKAGERKKLMEIARQNLSAHFQSEAGKQLGLHRILENLAEKLELSVLPQRIECFDVSHISGTDTVGSQVTFVIGEAFKEGYRRYKIKSAGASDDYAAMKEIISRRLKDREQNRPDLILVDGGKGQLKAAEKILQELDITGIALAGIAKGLGPGARAKGRWTEKKEDEVYLPGRKNPVLLKSGSPELMLLQNIRDEAHRFAITYHRYLRDKGMSRSWLDDVPGIGVQARKALLKHFGSPENVYQASEAMLRQTPGINESQVINLLTHKQELRHNVKS